MSGAVSSPTFSAGTGDTANMHGARMKIPLSWFDASIEKQQYVRGNIGGTTSKTPSSSSSAPNSRSNSKTLLPGGPDNGADQDYQQGLELLQGRSVVANPRLAAFYFRRASGKGHSRAEYIMAMLHKTGYEGILPSARKYLFFLQRSARHGLAVAQLELGLLYLRGFLLPKDVNRGKRLLRRAAQCGEVGAWKHLALSATGEESSSWWEKAAKQGDAEALYVLAMRGLNQYPDATSPPMSSSQAIEQLKTAANKQWPEALHALGEMYRGVAHPAYSYRLKEHMIGQLLRRDCVKSARYLALACDELLNRRNQLEKEARAYEEKLLTCMGDFDQAISSQLLLARVVNRWRHTATRRKALLRRLIAKRETTYIRPAWKIWQTSVLRRFLDLRVGFEEPFEFGKTLGLCFAQWAFRAVVVPKKMTKIVRANARKKNLRKALQSWRACTIRRRMAVFVLVEVLKQNLRKKCTTLLPSQEERNYRRGTKLLEKMLRRKLYQSACSAWRLTTVQRQTNARFVNEVRTLSDENRVLQQDLRTTAQRLAELEREAAAWKKRYDEEHTLNQQLLQSGLSGGAYNRKSTDTTDFVRQGSPNAARESQLRLLNSAGGGSRSASPGQIMPMSSAQAHLEPTTLFHQSTGTNLSFNQIPTTTQQGNTTLLRTSRGLLGGMASSASTSRTNSKKASPLSATGTTDPHEILGRSAGGQLFLAEDAGGSAFLNSAQHQQGATSSSHEMVYPSRRSSWSPKAVFRPVSRTAGLEHREEDSAVAQEQQLCGTGTEQPSPMKRLMQRKIMSSQERLKSILEQPVDTDDEILASTSLEGEQENEDSSATLESSSLVHVKKTATGKTTASARPVGATTRQQTMSKRETQEIDPMMRISTGKFPRRVVSRSRSSTGFTTAAASSTGASRVRFSDQISRSSTMSTASRFDGTALTAKTRAALASTLSTTGVRRTNSTASTFAPSSTASTTFLQRTSASNRRSQNLPGRHLRFSSMNNPGRASTSSMVNNRRSSAQSGAATGGALSRPGAASDEVLLDDPSELSSVVEVLASAAVGRGVNAGALPNSAVAATTANSATNNFLDQSPLESVDVRRNLWQTPQRTIYY
ncbi:unnamed protein product [Amoebophrya sp. A120]|nr:unnamed protein product [Amoebophrya sp. A120]|eukprot:GSA120T00011499001.1